MLSRLPPGGRSDADRVAGGAGASDHRSMGLAGSQDPDRFFPAC